MLKSKLFKLICLIIACMMVFALFTGCVKEESDDDSGKDAVEDQNDQDQTSNDEQSEEDTISYDLPLVDEEKTITIMTRDNYYAPKSYTQGLPVWEEIEEVTGVNVEWMVAPKQTWEEMLQIKFAAAEDLPDVCWLIPDAQKYGRQGILIDTLPYLEKYNPPALWDMLKEYPLTLPLLMTPDGKLFEIGHVNQWGMSDNGVWHDGSLSIRKDWLDELGLDLPRTTDEFYQVMKAFQENDMNGDGKPNEYLNFGGKGSKVWDFTGEYFGLQFHRSEGFVPDENGKIYSQFTTERCKDWLAYFNKLYEEGISHPEWLSQNKNQWIAAVKQNKSGAEMPYAGNGYDCADYIRDIDPDVEYAPLHLEGPYGDYFKTEYIKMQPRQTITKDADVKLALKFMNFLATDQGRDYCGWGVEGLTYEVKDNGEYVFKDIIANNPNGLNFNNALKSFGGMYNFMRYPPASYEEYKSDPEKNPKRKYIMHLNTPAKLQSPCPLIQMTPEEQEVMNRYETDLMTFIHENVVKFLLGEQDIEEFDDFAEKLQNDMNLDKVLEVKQAQYDRYLKMCEKYGVEK